MAITVTVHIMGIYLNDPAKQRGLRFWLGEG
jgi:hypothetical protein